LNVSDKYRNWQIQIERYSFLTSFNRIDLRVPPKAIKFKYWLSREHKFEEIIC
jgi:hypothetical protein